MFSEAEVLSRCDDSCEAEFDLERDRHLRLLRDRDLDRDLVLDLVLDLALALPLDRDLNRGLDRVLDFDLDLEVRRYRC